MIFKSNSFSKNSNIHHAFFSRKNGASKGIYESLNCGLGSKDKKKYVYQNIEIVNLCYLSYHVFYLLNICIRTILYTIIFIILNYPIYVVHLCC